MVQKLMSVRICDDRDGLKISQQGDDREILTFEFFETKITKANVNKFEEDARVRIFALIPFQNFRKGDSDLFRKGDSKLFLMCAML